MSNNSEKFESLHVPCIAWGDFLLSYVVLDWNYSHKLLVFLTVKFKLVYGTDQKLPVSGLRKRGGGHEYIAIYLARNYMIYKEHLKSTCMYHLCTVMRMHTLTYKSSF